jgi:hypothetical protein
MYICLLLTVLYINYSLTSFRGHVNKFIDLVVSSYKLPRIFCADWLTHIFFRLLNLFADGIGRGAAGSTSLCN